MADPPPSLTDRLVLELQGRNFTLAIAPAGEGFPITGADADELAALWPTQGTWQLVAIDELSGRRYPAKLNELADLIKARQELDRG